MLNEHDIAVLACDIPDEGLKEGDVGTVVHVYPGGQAYEVEFVSMVGEKLSVVTLNPDQLRPVRERELYHARLVTK
jgi:hypothetical protein